MVLIPRAFSRNALSSRPRLVRTDPQNADWLADFPSRTLHQITQTDKMGVKKLLTEVLEHSSELSTRTHTLGQAFLVGDLVFALLCFPALIG